MRPAEQQHEPRPRSGLSRMVAVSAVLHVAVIVFLLVATSRKDSESSPRPLAHTVELVSPGVLEPSGGGGAKPAPAARPPAEQKSLPPKPERKEPPAVKRPAEPPQARKAVEPPKPKEPPAPKAQETPKVVAAKPLPQEPPAVKPKPVEPTKPKEAVKLPEQTKKTEPKRPQAKNPPVDKSQSENKPKATTRKSESPSASNAKEQQAEEREDGEAREREQQLLAAVERIRANEEAARRENEIAVALERVRKGVTEKADGKGDERVTSRETPGLTRQEKEGAPHEAVGGGGGHGVEFIAYTQHIKQKVKEAWILAERKPGLRAVVRFGVEPNGEVMEAELADSSGDRAFDQSTLRAVRKASPFPSPPEAYREEFATQKVEITFSGEERIR